ncbi:ABC transporter ATP-binding protein [bacterium]|nr:ABC transporter ATP-binding protein [bacterium]
MIEKQIPVLKIENLSKDFSGTKVLSNINLILNSPGVYGFLGPNGAGKTTTFKLICALLKPTAGRIFISGEDVQKETKAAMEHLGVQFDSPAFYPYLTGVENLKIIGKWIRLKKTYDIKRLLSFAGLSESGSKKVKEYSWGMKQRLGIAAALLPNPELVLLDEPTNGLDPSGIAYMRELLPTLAHEQGRTVLLSSHRMEEVEQVCDKVIIIHKGAIVASGAPSEFTVGKTLELICDNPNSVIELLNKLDKINNVTLLSNNKIQIIAPELETREIKTFLTKNLIVIKEINEKRETLENAFFRLTKGSKNEK